jgi:hypothetical protein
LAVRSFIPPLVLPGMCIKFVHASFTFFVPFLTLRA